MPTSACRREERDVHGHPEVRGRRTRGGDRRAVEEFAPPISAQPGVPGLRMLDEHGGLAGFLPSLGLAGATVADRTADLEAAVPAPSALLLDGVADVRGVYDPRWVGHRTLVARAEDLVGFWRNLPAEMLDPRTFVPIGFDAPGYVRPCYGLGVMADPGARSARSWVMAAVAPAMRRPSSRCRVPTPSRSSSRPTSRIRHRRPRSSCLRPPSAVAAKSRSTNPFNPVQRGRKGVG